MKKVIVSILLAVLLIGTAAVTAGCTTETERLEKRDRDAAGVVITLIADIQYPFPEHYDDIFLFKTRAAKTKYDTLNERARTYVSNYNILVEAIAFIKSFTDKENAASVTGMIQALSTTINYSDIGAVGAAREAYNRLTQDERNYVPQNVYNKLLSAEETAKNQIIVRNVYTAMKKLQQGTTDEKAINSVWNDYLALTLQQREIVDRLYRDEFLRLVALRDNMLVKLTADFAANKQLIEEIIAKINATAGESDFVYCDRAFIVSANQKMSEANQALAKFTPVTVPRLDSESDEQYDSKVSDYNNRRGLLEEAKVLLSGNTELIQGAERVLEVYDTITALPTEVPLRIEDATALQDRIDLAQNKLDALAALKSKVENASKLTSLKVKYADYLRQYKLAQAVHALILKIPSELQYGHKAIVVAARNAFDEAAPEVKALVIQLDTKNHLENSEKTMSLLEAAYANQQAADAVTREIMTLDSTEISLTNFNSSRTKYTNVRSVYDSPTLTDTQRALISKQTVEIMDAYLARVVFFEKTDAVRVMIVALDVTVTLDLEADIRAAREAFGKLSPAQTALIAPENLILVRAEQAINKIISDNKAVLDAKKAIAKLPQDVSSVTEADGAAISEANSFYTALSDELKLRVENDPPITEGIKDNYSHYEAVFARFLIVMGRKQEAKTVVDEINRIGVAVLSQFDAYKLKVRSARASYDNFVASDGANPGQVTNLDTLLAAEDKIVQMEPLDKQWKDAVAAIGALPDTVAVQISDRSAVVDAQTLIDALNDDQHAIVVTRNAAALNKLKNLFARIDDLEKSGAVIDAIDALPTLQDLALSDKAAVTNAFYAYSALPERQRNLVTNFMTLTQLRTRISALEVEKADTDVANAFSRDCLARVPAKENLELGVHNEIVASFRLRYNGLTAGQISKVSADALNRLLQAETTLAAMQKSKNDINAVMLVVDDIETLHIEDIDYKNPVMLNSYEVKLARIDKAILALTADQRALFVSDSTAAKAMLRYNNCVLKLAEENIKYAENGRAAAWDSYVVSINVSQIGELSGSVLSMIERARNDYNALYGAQIYTKQLDKLVFYENLVKAKQANDAILSVYRTVISRFNLSAVDKALTDALGAYNRLPDSIRGKVADYEKIELKRTELAQKKLFWGNVDAMDAAIANVNYVGNVTVAHKAAIRALSKQFEALSSEEKEQVASGYRIKLVGLIGELNDAENALVASIVSAINALPQPSLVTAADKNAIYKVRADYLALDAEQKEKVTNYALFVQIRAALAVLEVDDFNARIDALPTPASYTYQAHEKVVKTFLTDFDGLPSDIRDKFAPAKLDKVQALREKHTAGQILKASDMYTSIVATMQDFQLSHYPALNAANAAFSDLSADQKAQFENNTAYAAGKKMRVDLNYRYERLIKMQTLQNKINALWEPDSLTLESDLANITAYYNEYTMLTDSEKKLDFSPVAFAKLEASRNKMDALKKTATDLNSAIANIGIASVTFTPETQALLESMRASYLGLSILQQELVPNIALLEALEAELTAQRALAAAVVSKMALIPTQDITIAPGAGHETLYLAAKTLYTDLLSYKLAENPEKGKAMQAAVRAKTEYTERYAPASVVLEASRAKVTAFDRDFGSLLPTAAAPADEDALYNYGVTELFFRVVTEYQKLSVDERAASATLTIDRYLTKMTQLRDSVDNLIAAVKALPASVTIQNRADFVFIKNTYDAFDDLRKNAINGETPIDADVLAKFDASVTKLAAFDDGLAADCNADIAALIAKLDADTLTLDDAQAVLDARAKVNELPAELLGRITLDDLAACEARIEELRQAA